MENRNGAGAEKLVDRLWDVAEVARFLGMSKSWVYRESASGRLPCLKLNGWSVRFDPSQIREYARGSATPDAPVVRLNSKKGT